jgi:hypothetical protein
MLNENFTSLWMDTNMISYQRFVTVLFILKENEYDSIINLINCIMSRVCRFSIYFYVELMIHCNHYITYPLELQLAAC